MKVLQPLIVYIHVLPSCSVNSQESSHTYIEYASAVLSLYIQKDKKMLRRCLKVWITFVNETLNGNLITLSEI